MRADQLITLKGFLSHLLDQHNRRKDRPFCFILGAGASSASGIPTGTEMARDWLQQIHEAEDFTGSKLEDWATSENLGIEDFDLNNLGRSYPEIYSRRFNDSREAGYAFLEDKMQGKEPSFGYSVLAHILSETPHKIVITTNFDNLVADALSIHSTTFPIVVGHDSLASYAQVDLRRPLIAKVHGGLGFAPKSSPEALQALSETWQKALQSIFARYSPIIIGYDGNDGCLMKLLEDMKHDEIDGFYWCFHCPDDNATSQVSKVPERVRNLVKAKHGRLVPIPGFDELMLLIKERLGPVINMPNLLEQMRDRARQRENTYDEQERALTEKLKIPTRNTKGARQTKGNDTGSDTEVDKMLAHAVTELTRVRKEKPWWVWEDEASSAKTVDEKDRIYQEALAAFPKSAELLGNYALFLKNERKDPDNAEEIFKRAIDSNPKIAAILSNYATFLCDERKNPDKAELFFKRAIDSNPNHATIIGNYAIFLKNERKNPDKAELFFKRAIDADPNHANNLGNYAIFLNDVRKDPDRAEEFYKRVIDADPNHANNLGNYAVFLNDVRKDLDRAEEFYKRAIEADPNHANNLGNYAVFLKKVRKDPDRAEEFYKRAIDANPQKANNLSNYAKFLNDVRKDPDRAEEFYKRAIEADPNHANILGGYAVFLKDVHKDPDRAEEFYKRAIEADPNHANNLGNFGQFHLTQGRVKEGLALCEKAESLTPLPAELEVELCFYRLAHDSNAWPNKLNDMARLLIGGARSLHWPLEENLTVAEKDGHPNPALLRAIAGVISKNDPLETLDTFEEWPKEINGTPPSSPSPEGA